MFATHPEVLHTPPHSQTDLFNPFMRSGLWYFNPLDRSISNSRGVRPFFAVTMFYRHYCIFKVYIEDPDRTLRSAASDLGLHCLSIPASILYKSTAGRYRPVSYTDGPITARYRFM